NRISAALNGDRVPLPRKLRVVRKETDVVTQDSCSGTVWVLWVGVQQEWVIMVSTQNVEHHVPFAEILLGQIEVLLPTMSSESTEVSQLHNVADAPGLSRHGCTVQLGVNPVHVTNKHQVA